MNTMNVDLKALIAKLNSTCRNSLEAAAGLCMSRTNYNVEIEHLLIKLIGRFSRKVFLVGRKAKQDACLLPFLYALDHSVVASFESKSVFTLYSVLKVVDSVSHRISASKRSNFWKAFLLFQPVSSRRSRVLITLRS